jgi:NAD(P)H-dependent flavin oxidoreductase YrpB (nitropropane dioxygenase family)
MTELFGAEHLIMLTGMNGVITRARVAALSNVGGLDVLAGSRYGADNLKRSIAGMSILFW